jgi:hypothetical protein
MTPATARLLRQLILGLAFLILLVNILGMLDVIPNLARPRDLNLIAFALVLISIAFRRRGAGPQP